MTVQEFYVKDAILRELFLKGENTIEKRKIIGKLAEQNGEVFVRVCIAYRTSKNNGNELLNFDDIFEKDVDEIVKVLENSNIDTFTISSTWSSLVAVLVKFMEHGYAVCDKTMVSFGKPFDDTEVFMPAIVLKKQ